MPGVEVRQWLEGRKVMLTGLLEGDKDIYLLFLNRLSNTMMTTTGLAQSWYDVRMRGSVPSM